MVGVVLLLVAERVGGNGEWLLYGIGSILTLPILLALSIAVNRKRAAKGELSADSVEHKAAHMARSGSFGDALVIVCLLLIPLSLRPGKLPVLWGVLCLALIVISFWIRYVIALKKLRG
ncbi:MAG: hypothetical protein ACRDAX_04275 [Propionibacteriaceae bacterium]